MSTLRGDSRVGCESLIVMSQQNLEQPAAGNVHTTADGKTQTVKKGPRSGNSLTLGSLRMIGLPKTPISPGRIRSNSLRSYSGNVVSIIPKEAVGKKKGSGFESEEPTSPKVTCIGQIKSKPTEVSSKKRPVVRSRDVSESSCHAKLLSKLIRRFLFAMKKGVCVPESRLEKVQNYEPTGFGKDFVASAGSFKMDNPLPKPELKIGSSEINLWKRRSMAPPQDLRPLEERSTWTPDYKIFDTLRN